TQTDNGRVKIVHYSSDNLVIPLVNDILSTDLSGSTCVLTRKNDEAEQVTGLLLKRGMSASLIQDISTFDLYNLCEIRHFINLLERDDAVPVIDDEAWHTAKRRLENAFRSSSKLEICLAIIKDFESTNPKRKYLSDFDVFVRESKLEDFYNDSGETIFVSTIHKAKGKEFDNVFLLLQDVTYVTDEVKRQL